MSAETTQSQPLLAPDQAGHLLDQVIHERVLECLDLDKLHDLEQSLILTAGDLDGISPSHAADLARAIVDRALAQLAGDARRYLRFIDFMACDGCVLCKAEAREASEAPMRSSAASRGRPPGGDS